MRSQHQERRFGSVRIILIALAIATLWKVWLPAPQLPVAYGQIPDSGKQRQLILEEVRKTNLLLTELSQIAKTHTFKVRVEGTDKKTAPR